jgi:flagellar biosynthetic protein FliQ
MTQGEIINIAQQAIYTIIIIAGPMLGFGLLVGVMVAIFQATTQINEQTLVFIPKILAVFITLIVFGPWMLNTIIDFTNRLYNSINVLVG